MGQIPSHASVGNPQVCPRAGRAERALISVSGPTWAELQLGTTVEAVMAAINAVRKNGGLVIAERNSRCRLSWVRPFRKAISITCSMPIIRCRSARSRNRMTRPDGSGR